VEGYGQLKRETEGEGEEEEVFPSSWFVVERRVFLRIQV
jgi:hypothetical protein